jgi:hypothetical protein
VDSKFDLNHLYAVRKFELNLAAILLELLFVTTRLVSSANKICVDSLLIAIGKSFMYNKNNNGPKTEP